MSEKSAKGVTGFIIFDCTTNKPLFRVYDYKNKDKDGVTKFVDYNMHHDDLKVTIKDDMAVFTETKDGDPCITYRKFDPSKPHTVTKADLSKLNALKLKKRRQ